MTQLTALYYQSICKTKANDTFVILNIDMPSNYLEAAQRKIRQSIKGLFSTKEQR